MWITNTKIHWHSHRNMKHESHTNRINNKFFVQIGDGEFNKQYVQNALTINKNPILFSSNRFNNGVLFLNSNVPRNKYQRLVWPWHCSKCIIHLNLDIYFGDLGRRACKRNDVDSIHLLLNFWYGFIKSMFKLTYLNIYVLLTNVTSVMLFSIAPRCEHDNFLAFTIWLTIIITIPFPNQIFTNKCYDAINFTHHTILFQNSIKFCKLQSIGFNWIRPAFERLMCELEKYFVSHTRSTRRTRSFPNKTSCCWTII